MPRKYTMRSKEEKLAVVNHVLAGSSTHAWEPEIDHHQVRNWVQKYQIEGEIGLVSKKKPGNPLARYERRKELTYEEQLQYQIELLRRELLVKEAEVAHLKQQNARKGVDARKK